MKKFAAIDFETANHYRDSACACALVKIEDGRITERSYHLINTPSKYFRFTYSSFANLNLRNISFG